MVWSAAEPTADDLDIYSFDLKRGKRISLINTPGNQVSAVIIGDTLVWQDEADKAGKAQIKRQSLREATNNARPRRPTERTPEPQVAEPREEAITPMGHTGTYTRPTYKGMHLAHDGYNSVKGWGGWYFSTGQPCNGITCIIDGFGAPNAPFFGSFLAMETEFGFNTGRPAPWGPTVKDAMRNLQTQYSVRVVVRTYPTHQPNSGGTVHPANVVERVLNLARNHDWIRHVQLENEPNLEWEATCSGCRWNTSSTSYTWINRDDAQFYYAINEFYSDAWWEINYWKTNYSDPTVRARLTAMEVWTPPMTDFYKYKDEQSFYVQLQGMIDLFDRFTYHTYPAPNHDADGAGGIKNNSWTYFSPWLRTSIDNGSVRSMITEFGWNPGQMIRPDCNMAQHKTWPATGTCAASDARTHTFDNDIKRFLAYHRYRAEVVAVWMARGWRTEPDPQTTPPTYYDTTDGIDQNGNTRTWFHNYQWSSP